MPKASIPEGVTLVQTKTGRRTTRRSRYGSTIEFTIDSEWEVFLNDVSIGFVAYEMLTRETRSAGKRYVNSRWESPGWVTRNKKFGYRFECYSKTNGIDRLMRDAERNAR